MVKADIRSRSCNNSHRYHTENNRATASDHIGNAFSVLLVHGQDTTGIGKRKRLEKSMR